MTHNYSLEEVKDILTPKKSQHDVKKVLASIIIHLVGENKFIPIPEGSVDLQRDPLCYGGMKINGVMVINHKLYISEVDYASCRGGETFSYYFGKPVISSEKILFDKRGLRTHASGLWEICELLMDEEFAMVVKTEYKEECYIRNYFNEYGIEKWEKKKLIKPYDDFIKPFIEEHINSFLKSGENHTLIIRTRQYNYDFDNIYIVENPYEVIKKSQIKNKH